MKTSWLTPIWLVTIKIGCIVSILDISLLLTSSNVGHARGQRKRSSFPSCFTAANQRDLFMMRHRNRDQENIWSNPDPLPG